MHELDLSGLLEPFKAMLGLTEISPRGVVLHGFPTLIDRQLARGCATDTQIQSLVERNILWAGSQEAYSLIDEFLRVRLLLDALDEADDLEERLLVGRMLTLEGGDEGVFLPYDEESDDER